ncbi:hypothetical protein N0V82_001738 [Gnomoniopsis sp. IMI 355080]|nr:hypothetical protein N0V82_001738 [Gnomoniopsis sp. IMI 355080]
MMIPPGAYYKTIVWGNDAAEYKYIKMSAPSNADKIASAQANLPLPEQPPVASDWNSADERTVNVGAGGVSSGVSTGDGETAGLREPASKATDVDLSKVGRQGKDGLDGLPKDATA